MRHISGKRIITILAFGLLTGWAAPWARAGVIYSQPYDGSSPGFNSQIYTDSFAPFSTKAFDDVTVRTGAVWNISQVTIFGQEQGDPTQNALVKLQFASSPNYNDPAPTFGGTENASGNLVFTSPIRLTAGTYWISAWVQRPDTSTGGQWFWYETNVGNPMGSEWYYQNPGGGYYDNGNGSGNAPGTQAQPGSNITGIAADLAFEIDGVVTPEPPSWCLLGLGGMFLLVAGLRKRINVQCMFQACLRRL